MAPEILRSEIATFSKQLVARLAPGEVEFFDQIEASFKGRSSYTPTPVEDDPMQFGLHDATSLITPAAIAATSAVFLYLRSIFSEVAKNVGTKVLTEQVSRLLR